MTIQDTYQVGDKITIGDGTDGVEGTITATDPDNDTYQIDFTNPDLTDGLYYSRLGTPDGNGIHAATS